MQSLFLGLLACGLHQTHGHSMALHGSPVMNCSYSVVRQPATGLVGTIPSYLTGTFFHGVYKTNIEGIGLSTLGAALAVEFGAGMPTISFGISHGSKFQARCSHNQTASYVPDGVVTLSKVNGEMVYVTAMPDVQTWNGKTAEASGEIVKMPSLGPRQSPPGGPDFYGPSHIPTDVNGDLYGIAYIYSPAPAYRVYRIPANSTDRTVLSDIPAHPQTGDAPAYNHQALTFTENYIIIPEQPVKMSPNGDFDWAKIQAGWIPTGNLYFRVLSKATGKEMATFEAPPCFSWHHGNSWENSTHIVVDLTWYPDTAALNVFINVSTAKKSIYDMGGRLMRYVMPNPAFSNSTTVVHYPLGAADYDSYEFVVTNNDHQFRRPTRSYWGLAAEKSLQAATFWPVLVKVDTIANTTVAWTPPEGFNMDPPMYVAATKNQDPNEDAGAVIVLTVSADRNVLIILDAPTLTQVAAMDLPVIPLASTGLHNYYSEFPTSV